VDLETLRSILFVKTRLTKKQPYFIVAKALLIAIAELSGGPSLKNFVANT
jgi:hypothetical protein